MATIVLINPKFDISFGGLEYAMAEGFFAADGEHGAQSVCPWQADFDHRAHPDRRLRTARSLAELLSR